jgi:hypothetical protein
MEIYNIFDADRHLQPEFKKTEFEALIGWDWGWALLEPIDIAQSSDDDEELSKRFSPGQKTLYFFWYLDGQVTNGGFAQFYFNGYRRYLPIITEGLKLIGDHALLAVIEHAENAYLKNQELINRQIAGADPRPLYKLNDFEFCNSEYFRIHDSTMSLIEKYGRAHPEEFVKLI